MNRRRESYQIQWSDVGCFLLMSLAWVVFAACLLGWFLGVDSWAIWAVAPIAWGKPDRVLARGVCDSVERVTPGLRRRERGLGSAIGWGLVIIGILFVLSTVGGAA